MHEQLGGISAQMGEASLVTRGVHAGVKELNGLLWERQLRLGGPGGAPRTHLRT